MTASVAAIQQNAAGDILRSLAQDPATFFRLVWPDVRPWRAQVEINESVRDNFSTIVCSCTESGKDWIAARTLVWFYSTRFPARVIATSTSLGQLKRALWGEVGKALREAKLPLGIDQKHLVLRRLKPDGRPYEDDWVQFVAVSQVENLMGTHLAADVEEPAILAIVDESSGVSAEQLEALEAQAHRILSIGNPMSVSGYYAEAIRRGDVPDEFRPGKFRRKLIRIDARQTPNVAVGTDWDKGGRQGPCPRVIPGLMSYADYCHHLREWPDFWVMACLYGQLPEGLESQVIVPREWLEEGRRAWAGIDKEHRATLETYMGIDASHGRNDLACWAVTDRLGIKDLVTMDVRAMRDEHKLPQTRRMLEMTKLLMHKYSIKPHNVAADVGGGGQEAIVDPLRLEGKNVRGVNFGSRPTKQRVKQYTNRRAELFGELAKECDPSKWRKVEVAGTGVQRWDRCFSLPPEGTDSRLDGEVDALVQELSLIPKGYEADGRLFILPKRRKTGQESGRCLAEILGHSPDRSDAVTLSNWAMRTRQGSAAGLGSLGAKLPEMLDVRATKLWEKYVGR